MDTSGSIAKTSSRNSSAGKQGLVRYRPRRRFGLPTEILGTAAPRLQVRGRRDVATPRIRSSSAAVARPAHHQNRSRHRNLSLPRRLDRGSSSGRLATASRRRYRAATDPESVRSRRSIPTRSPCARPVPARDRPPDDPSHGARQTVHDDQRVTRERPRARRRDSKVQERGTALELLVSEHRARCLGAEPEVRGDRRVARNSSELFARLK